MISDKQEFLNKCKDPKFVQNIIDNFHKLYYYSSAYGMTWKNTFWLGVPIQKTPTDCFVYQEIMHCLRPDYIIETGTKVGGSALFFANVCDIIDHGEVISIDIDEIENLPQHERILYLTGDSVDPYIVDLIKEKIKGKKVMVILDSDHSKDHVLKELEIYSKMVTIGNYLIVEDTNINGFSVYGIEGEGPLEAVKDFLGRNDNFKIDRNCEKFYLSFSPMGFLVRVK